VLSLVVWSVGSESVVRVKSCDLDQLRFCVGKEESEALCIQRWLLDDCVESW